MVGTRPSIFFVRSSAPSRRKSRAPSIRVRTPHPACVPRTACLHIGATWLEPFCNARHICVSDASTAVGRGETRPPRPGRTASPLRGSPKPDPSKHVPANDNPGVTIGRHQIAPMSSRPAASRDRPTPVAMDDLHRTRCRARVHLCCRVATTRSPSSGPAGLGPPPREPPADPRGAPRSALVSN
jgi:hypothetical protein